MRPTRRLPLTDYHRFLVRHRDFVDEIDTARRRSDERLSRLRQLPRSEQRSRVRKLLVDRGIHKVFAFQAIRKAGRLAKAEPEEIIALAETFDAFTPVQDEIYITRPVSRQGRRVRFVQDFGPKRRMHQSLVDRILRELHPPLDCQKLFRGGMPMARRAIEAAVANGNVFGAEVDFVGFYPSIRPEVLPELLRPLPASVVRAVVWDDVVVRPSGALIAFPIDTTSSPFSGLSLGSACSPIVGERIIAELLGAAQISDVVTFADNLFVYGRSTEDVRAKIKTLRDTVRNHPVGGLELSIPEEGGLHDLSLHFEFAQQAGVLRDGQIEWSPGSRKLSQFQISEAANLSLPEIDAAERSVVHWRRAYPDWHEGDAFAAEYRAALAVRRSYLNRNPMFLREARDAVIIAYHERKRVEPNFPGGVVHFIPTEGDVLGDGYGRLLAELERLCGMHA